MQFLRFLKQGFASTHRHRRLVVFTYLVPLVPAVVVAAGALVIDAMHRFAELTVRGHNALLSQDTDQLTRLIDENFDCRRSIFKLPDWQVKMVETARQCGASAKFAGSGGAVIGIYRDEAMFDEICDRMAAFGSRTIKPIVTV